MMRSVLLFLSTICLSGASHAQAQGDSLATLGSVYLATGGFFSGDQALYHHDIALLTPGSSLLAGDLSDHDFYNDDYGTNAPLFEAGIGLHAFRRGARRGPELRLGLLYGGRNARNAFFSLSTSSPYDTLTSSQTGEQYLVDSVHRSTYWIEHSAERFGVSTSLTWRTNGRWSVYGGIGLSGGVLLNARTEVHHSVYDRVEGALGYPLNNMYDDLSREVHYTGEVFQHGTGWWLGLTLPFGVDFQIARKNAFWRHMHAYLELAPQMLFDGDPVLGSSTSFGSRNGFGLRYAF